MKTSHLSKLTETLYRASCSVEVKAEDWVLRPGTISPDKWNPASRICSDTGTDYFKAKYIMEEYIGAAPAGCTGVVLYDVGCSGAGAGCMQLKCVRFSQKTAACSAATCSAAELQTVKVVCNTSADR